MYDKRRKEIMTHCFEPSKFPFIKSGAESSMKSTPSLKRELGSDNCQSKHKKSDMKGDNRLGQDVLAESSKSAFAKSGNKSSTKSQSSPHRKTASDNHQSEHKKNDMKEEKKLAQDVLAESSKSPFAKSGTKSSTMSQPSPQRASTSGIHENEPKKDDVKQKEDEKLLVVGDWVVQKSSAGKKYYYNKASDISQWEKPQEIIEFEQQHNLKNPSKKSHGKNSNDETSNEDTKMSSTAALYNQLKQLEVVLEDVMKSKDFKDYKYQE